MSRRRSLRSSLEICDWSVPSARARSHWVMFAASVALEHRDDDAVFAIELVATCQRPAARRAPIGQSDIIGRIGLLPAYFLEVRSMGERRVMGFAALYPSYAGCSVDTCQPRGLPADFRLT